MRLRISWRLGAVGLTVLVLAAGLLAARFAVDPQAYLLWPQRLARAAGPLGWTMVFSLQVIVALGGVIPASLIGVASGALYGLGAGFCLAAAGTMTGAMLAFLLARSMLRPMAARLLRDRPRLRDLDEAIAREGWYFASLLRLSPLMPFAATSYALALTRISRRDYLLGTLAALPALFGYVLTGALVGRGLTSLGREASALRWTLLAAGLAATLLLTVSIGRLAMRGPGGIARPITGSGPQLHLPPAAGSDRR